MKEIHQIYDKAFKRILTLSDKAVINLINGLFGTDYPTNSKITYNWTEHEDKELIALLPFLLYKTPQENGKNTQ